MRNVDNWHQPLNNVYNYVGSAGEYDLTIPGRTGATSVATTQGSRYGYWPLDNVRFNTIIPPNGPSCTYNASSNGSEALLIPPTSFHTGGANLSLGDASVTFVSDTVSSETAGTTGLSTLGKERMSSGRSFFGIWGTMGSMNGGDSGSL